MTSTSYQVGDPDPTPFGDCPARYPADTYVMCTWDAGHEPPHVAGAYDAGDQRVIVAVWDA